MYFPLYFKQFDIKLSAENRALGIIEGLKGFAGIFFAALIQSWFQADTIFFDTDRNFF